MHTLHVNNALTDSLQMVTLSQLTIQLEGSIAYFLDKW